MSDGTKIEWTDATWNVVNGCTVHSPGCANCYAMRLAATRLRNHPSRAGLADMHNGHPQWTGEVRFNDKVLLDPLRWRRSRRIFVCAHGDLFHESVPEEWIDQVFAVAALAPQHQFQVLTKRADRMRAYFTHDGGFGRWGYIEHQARKLAKIPDHRTLATFGGSNLPNVWLGVSVEDQQRADERIPHLLATPAAVRWLSCEPLLGPVDIGWAFYHPIAMAGEFLKGGHFSPGLETLRPLDWVVVGGESGPGARPMHPAWARSLRNQCAAADVPFLFKQWGEFGPDLGPDEDRDRDGFQRDRVMEGRGPCAAWTGGDWQFAPDGYAMPLDLPGDDHEWVYRLGKARNGRHLDGQLHDGFPA